MTRKGIPIRKQTLDKLKQLKQRETERNTLVLERLLDKYEMELLNGE